MMVLFLTGLVAMILLRTLKRDYAKYTRADEDDIEVCTWTTPCHIDYPQGSRCCVLHMMVSLAHDSCICNLQLHVLLPVMTRCIDLRPCQALDRDGGEESGWKLVHGDVFRPPRHPELLSALVGTGAARCTAPSVLCCLQNLRKLSFRTRCMVRSRDFERTLQRGKGQAMPAHPLPPVPPREQPAAADAVAAAAAAVATARAFEGLRHQGVKPGLSRGALCSTLLRRRHAADTAGGAGRSSCYSSCLKG